MQQPFPCTFLYPPSSLPRCLASTTHTMYVSCSRHQHPRSQLTLFVAQAILHHIYKQTQGETWFRPTDENLQAGVALRVQHSPPAFRVFPYENMRLVPFEASIRALSTFIAASRRYDCSPRSQFRSIGCGEDSECLCRCSTEHCVGSHLIFRNPLHRPRSSISFCFIRSEEDNAIFVDGDTRIQILDTMVDLATAEKDQSAAFIVSLFLQCLNPR